jgi:hypothetical protein
MRLTPIAFAFALLAPASPCLAAKAATTAEIREAAASEAPAAEAEPKKERRICKREQRTGSNMPGRKICLTASAWKNRAGSDW